MEVEVLQLRGRLLAPIHQRNNHSSSVAASSYWPACILQQVLLAVLDGQHLLPQRLTEANFQFEYPQLKQALHDLLRGKSVSTVEKP